MLDVVAFVANQPAPVPRDAIAASFTGCNGWLTRVLTTLVEHGYLRRVAHGVYACGARIPGRSDPASSTRSATAAADLAGRQVLLFARWRTMMGHGLLDGIQQTLESRGVQLRVASFESPGTSIDQLLELPAAKDCDGLIFFDLAPLPKKFVDGIRQRALPAVQIGHVNSEHWDTVDWNRSAVFTAMTEALATAPCDDLFYLEAPPALARKPAMMEQSAAFIATALRAGLSYHCIADALADLNRPPPDSRLLGDLRALPKDRRPGILCGTPAQAVPLMLLLESQGKSLGRYVHVASVLDAADPHVDLCQRKFLRSFIKCDRHIGAAAAEQLLLRMAGSTAAPSLRLLACHPTLPAAAALARHQTI